MMNHESKQPVTIEDLLRLKRAERPAPEFWSEFDRELRAKQLAALVEKRPWWRSVPRAFRGLGRYHLPLGATAVLAITLLSIRDYHPVAPSAVNLGTDETSIRADAAMANEPASSNGSAPSTTVAAAPSTAEISSHTVALSSDATAPGQLARMVPMLSAGSPMANQEDIRPSARSMAENLAVAEAILGTPASSGFETRAIPARPTPREPLAQVPNPSESRRSRFAAAFASMSTDMSTVTTARVARRLSDEQLYDSIHRFGASGNSVSFKF